MKLSDVCFTIAGIGLLIILIGTMGFGIYFFATTFHYIPLWLQIFVTVMGVIGLIALIEMILKYFGGK